MGKLVGPCIQLQISEWPHAIGGSYCRWCLLDLGLKKSMEADTINGLFLNAQRMQVGFCRRAGKLMSLPVSQQRQLRESMLRMGNDALKKGLEMRRYPGNS